MRCLSGSATLIVEVRSSTQCRFQARGEHPPADRFECASIDEVAALKIDGQVNHRR